MVLLLHLKSLISQLASLYNLFRDFIETSINPKTHSRNFNPPLLIMNGFNSKDQSTKITGMLL